MGLTRALHLIHTMSSMLSVKAAVHGYYMYRKIFETHVGEEFIVIQESGKSHDRYEMAVYCRNKDLGVIVGNLPQEFSKACHYFTRHSAH